MDRQGYKSVKRAQRILDRDRNEIQQRRLKRMGFENGSIEPREGGEGLGRFSDIILILTS